MLLVDGGGAGRVAVAAAGASTPASSRAIVTIIIVEPEKLNIAILQVRFHMLPECMYVTVRVINFKTAL